MTFSWLPGGSELNLQQDLLDAAVLATKHYATTLDARAVFPSQAALASLAVFDEAIPEAPCDPGTVLGTLATHGAPATTASSGPNYYGFVTGGSLPIALAARWLGDGWDQNSALGRMSPIAAQLEQTVEHWVTDLLGLPDETVMGLVSGSSIAGLSALAAARTHLYTKAQWPFAEKGLHGAPPIHIYGPDSLHGSIDKALSILGFGANQMHWLATDSEGRLLPSALPTLEPNAIVILQAGQICTGAFDDFASIIPIVKAQGAWVHIDGAFGLWAAACGATRHLMAGADQADSWSVDAHKTLNVPYDCGLVLCRHPSALKSALTASGSYLDQSSLRNGMEMTPEMSRRARSVELWAALKFLGRSGVAGLIGHFCTLADQLREQLRNGPYTLINEGGFNQVLVALDEDAQTNAALQFLQASGRVWMSGATWQDRAVIRISISNWQTTEAHIRLLGTEMQRAAQAVQPAPPASS
ncbi:MAG: aspartate aminotransferase family protein [Gammaproteobacteria bacterium]|nr:aspartate aminotransferase family protein [Gammaproteobacteria bacterium]